MYAPWRSDYFGDRPEGCVFCAISKDVENDDKNHLFYRDEHCFLVMNKYPYTPGHFLIIPHAHIATPEELDDKTWLAISMMVKKSVTILKEAGAEGVNSGINILKSAGAGIPEHLHIHMVPRFNGDTNFITAISDTRIYGVDFESIYQKIKKISQEVLG